MPKTLTGCKTCRARKIKCPTERPACARCIKAGLVCPGYGPNVIWLPPNHESSNRQGAGGMPPPQSTWATQKVLDGTVVDQFISELTNTAVTQFERTQAQNAVLGPFSVLSFPGLKARSSSLLPRNPMITSDIWPIWPLDQESRSLFQHYISVISSKMMPFEDARNPWKTWYPSMALNEDSNVFLAIRHAILSQAAAHLQHVGYRTQHMKVLAMSHYSDSLKALSTYLRQTVEYDYGAVLASILSLIMAETYEGTSIAWRHHLKNAIDLATKALPKKPWLISETAWLTTQSLCMLKLRMNIELEFDYALNECDQNHNTWMHLAPPPHDTKLFRDLIASVSSRLEFGFTVGVSPEAVEGLNETVTLVRKVKNRGLTDACRSEVHRLTGTLFALAIAQKQKSTSPRHIHEGIFTLGIIIFLQRQTINPPPSALLPYTSSLFASMQTIDGLLSRGQPSDGTNRDSSFVSLWPVFLAAVECFRPEEVQIARSWLRNLGRSGIGNRGDVSKVVQEVWRERTRRYYSQAGHGADFVGDEKAVEDTNGHFGDSHSPTNIDGIGQIIIHWREVMQAQEIDILLV